jgi:hypothetical protein
MMRDDKLVRIAIKTGQPIERVVWIWGAVLESAAEIDDDGKFDVDGAEVAYFLRADQTDVDAIMSALAGAGHLAAGCVAKWGARQFISDRPGLRQAAYRERKKRELSDGGHTEADSGNVTVTLPLRNGNAPETEQNRTEHRDIPAAKATGRARAPAIEKPNGVSDQVWSDFEKHRRAKKAPITETALSAFRREADRVGWTLEAALIESVARDWRGFKAEWVENGRSQNIRGSNGAGPDKRSGLRRALDTARANLDAEIAALGG